MINYKEKLLKKFLKSESLDVQERYDHCLGVSKAIVNIISENKLDVDLKKAELTGLIHDYAKYVSKEEYIKLINKEQNPEDLKILEMNHSIWHALLGPYVIKNELKINDEEILRAIKYHTTGTVNMSPLGEALFIADFIEENRHGDCFNFARKLAKIDYKKAICYILEQKINNTNKKNNEVAGDTYLAYEYYKKYKVSSLDKAKMIANEINGTLTQDVIIYDCQNRTPLFDYAIVSTTVSERQMQAVFNNIRGDFNIRGYEIGNTWTLIDLSDVLLHVFYKEERNNYGIDRIYADLPKIEF